MDTLCDKKNLQSIQDIRTNDEITRTYINNKNLIEYPKRYTIIDFNKIIKWKEMKNIDDYKNYKKWKNGINPNTNRKITVGGRVHNKFHARFNDFIEYDNINKILKTIDQNEYEKTTKDIFFEIDEQNIKINEYNAEIKTIMKKISEMKDWYDYVEFNGVKYGTYNKVQNDVHVEKNCGGKIIFVREETEYHINDRPFCNYPDWERTYRYYICEKCNYEYRSP